MLTTNEIIAIKDIIDNINEESVAAKRIKNTFDKLENIDIVYFNTHRDVDWGNVHTQHSKYEAYSRE